MPANRRQINTKTQDSDVAGWAVDGSELTAIVFIASVRAVDDAIATLSALNALT